VRVFGTHKECLCSQFHPSSPPRPRLSLPNRFMQRHSHVYPLSSTFTIGTLLHRYHWPTCPTPQSPPVPATQAAVDRERIRVDSSRDTRAANKGRKRRHVVSEPARPLNPSRERGGTSRRGRRTRRSASLCPPAPATVSGAARSVHTEGRASYHTSVQALT
jgi:hypothetical protein